MKSQILQRQPPDRVNQLAILIVEDEQPIRDLLVTVLEEETAHPALAVADASQAVETARVITPGLLILDYGLPGIDGLKLHDLLHSIQGLETVPTIMLSAYAPSRQAMQERHITYLAKPFDLATLLDVVSTLL